MSVKIMIDSASDFTEEKARELGFLFMPINVQIGDEEYLDGVNLFAENFYNKLETSDVMPKTSLINEFTWNEAFENATKDGSDVIVITLSSKLSGTYNSALSASKKFNGKVMVIDSLSASFGEGALGLYALSLAKQNLSQNEIFDKLNKAKLNLKVYAVIDTLKYLKKGGRISATSAFVGTMLSIKPTIGLVDGEVKMISKAIGSKKGNNMLISIIQNAGEIDHNLPNGYIYSGTVNPSTYVFGGSNPPLPTKYRMPLF